LVKIQGSENEKKMGGVHFKASDLSNKQPGKTAGTQICLPIWFEIHETVRIFDVDSYIFYFSKRPQKTRGSPKCHIVTSKPVGVKYLLTQKTQKKIYSKPNLLQITPRRNKSEAPAVSHF
jgi:hypothetical protein